MRSTNLAFDLDYIWCNNKREDKMFNAITSDYMLKCDNYAVAYMFNQLLDKLRMCEHSDIVDDFCWPYSSIIFFTCRPQDVKRMKYVAKHIPSSIEANIKVFYMDDDTGEEVEV